MANSSRRDEILFVAALGVVLTAFYLSYGTYRDWPYKIESDGKYYYQYLVSAVQDGDLDFSDDYRVQKKPWMVLKVDHYGYRRLLDPNTGLPLNRFPFGAAILWAPAYAVVDALAILLGRPQDPWSRFYQYGVMFSAVLYTLLASWWMTGLLARWFTPGVRRATVALGVLGTNVLYYATVEPSMSHVHDLVTAVALAVAFARCLESDRLRSFVLFGVTGGIHTLVRPQNCITVAILGLWLAYFRLRGPQEDRGKAIIQLATAGGLAAGIAGLILAVNVILRGSMWRMSHGGSFFDFGSMHAVDVLFSQRNGLFSHHPLLLIGFAGLGAALWTGRYLGEDRLRILLPLALAFLVQVWMNGTTVDWWGGHAFGQRRLIGSYLPLMIGLAFVLQSWRDRSSRYHGVGVATVATIFVLMNVYLIYIHVYYWPYDLPHDIWEWMFRVAAKRPIGLAP